MNSRAISVAGGLPAEWAQPNAWPNMLYFYLFNNNLSGSATPGPCA